MQGLDQILGAGGIDIGALAHRCGLDPEQARSAMGALLPAVAGGFQKQNEAAGPAAVTQAAAANVGEPDTTSGNVILGQIFGSKDVSRQVADHAAGQSGISSTVLKAMLPIVAAMVAKHVAGTDGNPDGDAGNLGGLLGSVLGGELRGGSSGDNPLDAILAGLGRK